jgi:superfamily II DNA or RNA helicase
MIKLYPHQEKSITELRAELVKNKCVLLQAATGFGKTAIGAFMIKGALEKYKRTFFVVHRKELIEQTSNTLEKLNIHHSIIQSGRMASPFDFVFVASIDTLKKRLDSIKPPDFLIFDECHHVGSKGWAKVHAWAKQSGAYIIGLTATPWRLDKKGLDMFFDEIVRGPSVEWLIKNKYLSDYKAYALSIPDMSGTSISKGDFDIGEVEAIMRDNVLYGCAIDNWMRLAKGKKTIAFAPTIVTSKELVSKFIEAGIRAAHLDGENKPSIRKSTIMDFAYGKIDIISNVGLFGEGFDLSAIAGREVPIEAVIIYRPTQSLSLHLQMIGRAMRPKAEPAIILDHAGNCIRHGLPDMDFKWSLKGRKKKDGASENSIMVRQCPDCFACFKPANICPYCGHKFEKQLKTKEMIDGELKEVKRQQIEGLKRQKKIELKAAKTEEQLIELAKSRGYKFPKYWAKHILEGREKWKKK